MCAQERGVGGDRKEGRGAVGDSFTCSAVLDNLKTQAMILLTVLIFLLS